MHPTLSSYTTQIHQVSSWFHNSSTDTTTDNGAALCASLSVPRTNLGSLMDQSSALQLPTPNFQFGRDATTWSCHGFGSLCKATSDAAYSTANLHLQRGRILRIDYRKETIPGSTKFDRKSSNTDKDNHPFETITPS
ncbi:hypothetical protein COP1_002533 [Malus domestica]